ncbi:MAG: GNAT family N-acetyltransferase [Psychromonas sp.]
MHSISIETYSLAQQAAWAPSPINYQYWATRLSGKKPFLLLSENAVIGFIELESDGHIDCAYVHPDFQQQGGGEFLLTYLIEHANSLRLPLLYVEASLIAKPLFIKCGFKVIKQHTIIRNNQPFIQFLMQKKMI